MDMAVKLPEDAENAFVKAVAAEVVKQAMPVMVELARAAVQDETPSYGLTQAEVAKKLRMTVGTEDFHRMAYEVLPHYWAGGQARWNSRAIDKCLEDYSE